MPKIEFTKTFEKLYRDLHPDIKRKTQKALRLLAEDPRSPSLRSKPIKGIPGIYEARVDQNYLLTYERLPDDVLLIRVMGPHDQALKKP
jgi:mRNA interferase RelE/StbE